MCGFEALVRWVRPDGKVTYPSEFIKVAEETRLIIPLTDWVLGEACTQVAEWQRTFDRPLTLTINISSKLFDRPTLVDEVRQAIDTSGLLPGTLRLEITESFLLNSSDAVAQRLDELRSIPVELYLDDFGTGFSSLSYLHRYRLDALKIDQSFISRIGGVHNDAPNRQQHRQSRAAARDGRDCGRRRDSPAGEAAAARSIVRTPRATCSRVRLTAAEARAYLASQPEPHSSPPRRRPVAPSQR